MRRFFCLILIQLFIGSPFVHAQYYLSGQEPASIRWQQLQSGHFRIIFPKGAEHQAFRIAYLSEQAYDAVNAGLQAPPLSTDLILHTQSSISNATASWAPHRLDFYNTPPQNGYSQEWFRQLSLHELRHIAQMQSLNKGFVRFSSLLFGQQGLAAFLGVFVPTWFMEGDAVLTESILSNAGRGRQSLFEAGLRAQLLEHKLFSYDKAYFGSYRHHVPNVYEMGYYFVGYQQYKHGQQLWSGMLNEVARRPFLLNPVSRAMKEASGKNKNKLYKETFTELKQHWKTQDSAIVLSPVHQHSPSKHTYTNYRFPRPLTDGSLIAVRTSKDDITRIVQLKEGKEKLLFTPGSLFNESLSVTDSLVVWNEYQADIRWSNRDFSVIKIGDIHNGKIKQLSFKTHYFAPDISSDNKKIVAAETDEYGNYALVILAVEDGTLINKFQNDSLFFQTPLWMPDNLHIVASAVGPKGKAIIKLNSVSSEFELLLPFSFDDFYLSGRMGEELLLHGSWSGISNIYLLNTSDLSIKQLSSSRFGAAWAMADEQQHRIFYSDYHANGWQAVSMSVADARDTALEQVENTAFPLADLLSSSSSFNIDEVEIPDTAYLVKPYRKIAHLFRFHSWAPLYIEADNASFQPGLSLFSQNSLSTMIAELGYRFDPNQETGTAKTSISYYGWYPILNASVEHGARADIATIEDEDILLKWMETSTLAGISLPLNLTRDKWVRGIRSSINFRQTHRQMNKDIAVEFKLPIVRSMSYELQAYQYMRMSERALLPRGGISLYFLFRQMLHQNHPGQQVYGSTNLFLPGLAPSHGIRLFGAWQKQFREANYFSALTPIPRGYHHLFHKEAFSFKADYMFPIAYPELNWPTIAYFKRLRASIFTDYMSVYDEKWINFSSSGIELLTDWHFFNFPAPFSIGGRYSHTWNDTKPKFELLFGINFDAIR